MTALALVRPALPSQVDLPAHCLSVPGCTRPRLTYAGYCAEHSPTPVAPRLSGRCNAPIRCYCPTCLPDVRQLAPQHGPESIRLMLDELARRRAAKAAS